MSPSSRRRRLPCRPVPVDLHGRCFNCFAGSHRTAQCRSRTRCFRCHGLGHCSAACPNRVGVAPVRVPVWRIISLATAMSDSVPVPPVVVSHSVAATCPWPPMCAARTREALSRRTRVVVGAVVVGPTVDEGIPVTAPSHRMIGILRAMATISPARGPPCVIDWSEQVARAAADLRSAVLVTVVGTGGGPAMDDLNKSFDLNRATMVLRRSHLASVFILFTDNEATDSLPVQDKAGVRRGLSLAVAGGRGIQRDPDSCLGDVHSGAIAEPVWVAAASRFIHKE